MANNNIENSFYTWHEYKVTKVAEGIVAAEWNKLYELGSLLVASEVISNTLLQDVELDSLYLEICDAKQPAQE